MHENQRIKISDFGLARPKAIDVGIWAQLTKPCELRRAWHGHGPCSWRNSLKPECPGGGQLLVRTVVCDDTDIMVENSNGPNMDNRDLILEKGPDDPTKTIKFA